MHCENFNKWISILPFECVIYCYLLFYLKLLNCKYFFSRLPKMHFEYSYYLIISKMLKAVYDETLIISKIKNKNNENTLFTVNSKFLILKIFYKCQFFYESMVSLS